MVDLVLNLLVLFAMWIAVAIISVALWVQVRHGGRLSPERRAALRAAWDDVHRIERRIGVRPTRTPWWIDTKQTGPSVYVSLGSIVPSIEHERIEDVVQRMMIREMTR